MNLELGLDSFYDLLCCCIFLIDILFLFVFILPKKYYLA